MSQTAPSLPRPLPFWYVSGGCRSGKSAFAQRRAEACAPERLYLATWCGDALNAQDVKGGENTADAEMAERIRLHRATRGAGWRVYEPDAASLPDLARQLPGIVRPGEALLLDCLSLWAASCMRGEDAPPDFPARCAALLRCLWELPCPVFIVGSEVGLGLVPQSKAARTFRDMNGLAAQQAAAMADTVVFMVSGLPLPVKGNPDLPGAVAK